MLGLALQALRDWWVLTPRVWCYVPTAQVTGLAGTSKQAWWTAAFPRALRARAPQSAYTCRRACCLAMRSNPSWLGVESHVAPTCSTRIEAVSTYGSNCPSPPDFMLNQVKECATAASCNTTRLNIQLTRLKKCQDMRPTCRCLEPYSDYTATLDSCGKEPSAALADQFSGCTDGVRCVDSVANAYTAVVTCEQRQSDACDCLPKFTEYAELSSACFNATSADDPLAMFYDHCTADQDSQPSFVDFTTASFLAKEVDGEAKVVLRRFGGKGPKAMVASEAVLAVYSVDGAFTGVTTAVSWDEGEVNEQVVMLDIDDESLLYGLTKFKVEIVEVKGMLFGESSSAVVVVEPKPVPKVISVFYPSPGVEWSANTTRYVAYAATGFASGTMFSVDVYVSVQRALHHSTLSHHSCTTAPTTGIAPARRLLTLASAQASSAWTSRCRLTCRPPPTTRSSCHRPTPPRGSHRDKPPLAPLRFARRFRRRCSRSFASTCLPRRVQRASRGWARTSRTS